MNSAPAALEGVDFLAGLGVPHFHFSIEARSRTDSPGQVFAVWTERHLASAITVCEGEEFLAGLRVPYLHLTCWLRLIASPHSATTARGQALPVRAEHHADAI